MTKKYGDRQKTNDFHKNWSQYVLLVEKYKYAIFKEKR